MFKHTELCLCYRTSVVQTQSALRLYLAVCLYYILRYELLFRLTHIEHIHCEIRSFSKEISLETVNISIRLYRILDFKMSDKRTKESGNFYRNQKKRRAEENKTYGNELRRMLFDREPTSESSDNQNVASTSQNTIQPIQIPSADQNSNANSQISIEPNASPNCVEDTAAIPENSNQSNDEARTVQMFQFQDIDVVDPSTWPNIISQKTREYIVDSVENLPVLSADYPFPKSGSPSRSFNAKLYYSIAPNQLKIKRSWLVYSERIDSIFCFCCVLFDERRTKLSTPGCGYKDWGHVHNDLVSHEKTPNHKIAFDSWKQLRNRNSCSSTIDSYHSKMLQNETEQWKQIFFRIAVAIKFLAGQSLAFRGKTEKLYEHNNGNFLKLVESFAEFDPTMRAHIQKFLEGKSRDHYLSHVIQNEIIGIISKTITERIITMVKQSVYFSVIADTTSDLSHKEQLSIVLRIVFFDKDTATFKVNEHFLSFLDVVSTTGRSLGNEIITELCNNSLNMNFLRGTGFDNGPNMTGCNIGAQRIILDEYPRAFFMPCAAHSLNLVVNDMAKCSPQVQVYFAIIQDLFNFFSSSPKRWALLQKHATSSRGIVLKNLSDTRWASRSSAMKCLNENFPLIYDALIEVTESPDYDQKSKFTANSLGQRMFKFKFVLSSLIWYEFLSRINVVSKVLQSKSMDFNSCSEHLHKLTEYFVEIRTNSTFNSLYSKAEHIAEEMNIPVNFDSIQSLRSLRSGNANIQNEDPLSKYKADFYLYIIDVALNSLNERFSA